MISVLSSKCRDVIDRSFQMEDTTSWYAKRHTWRVLTAFVGDSSYELEIISLVRLSSSSR